MTSAEACFARGAAALYGQDDAAGAVPDLEAAAKLDPSRPAVWLALSEAAWTCGDADTAARMAERCQEEAEKAGPCAANGAAAVIDAPHRRMVDALVLRSAVERRKGAEDCGLDLARRAVEAGRSEPAAWACLGTALLASFFQGSAPRALGEARRAYAMGTALARREAAPLRGPGGGGLLSSAAGAAAATSPSSARAGRTPWARSFPDLHANEGSCLELLLDPAGAAAAMAAAAALDPGLGQAGRIGEVLARCKAVAAGVEACGHVGGKRLAARVGDWPPDAELEAWAARPDEEGGGGGRRLLRSVMSLPSGFGAPGAGTGRGGVPPPPPSSSSSSSPTARAASLVPAALRDAALPLLPLAVLTTEGEVPTVLACADRSGRRLALAVYNAGAAPLAGLCRPGVWVVVVDAECEWMEADTGAVAEAARTAAAAEAAAAAGDAAPPGAAAPAREALLPREPPGGRTGAGAATGGARPGPGAGRRKSGKPGKRKGAAPAAPPAALPGALEDGAEAGASARCLVVRALSPGQLRQFGLSAAAAGLAGGDKPVLRVGGAARSR